MKISDDLSLIGKIFWNKYKITKKIGQGSFGRIYQGINLLTEELYAIKFEDINEKSELLGKEAIFLYYLKGPGIPDIILYDTIDNYHILIESLLGKSLEVLFLESLYNFTIKDIAMIGIQILYRLEYIHNKYIIHRDIKPDNFVIGQDPNNNMIYIIDFGLAKKYRSSKTLEHIKFRLTKKLTGTTRYASVNALKGGEQSRRDDLESLAYMLFYFLRGNLPWQGAKGLTKEERYKKIYKIKKSTQPDELCMNFPEEFKFLLLYVKNLEFEEDPNYDYCRGLLENVLKKMNEKVDNNFSWCKRTGTDENKLRNQKLNVKKNFGQSIINTTGQTQKSAAVSNLINSMKSFHQNKKLINRISVILNDNKKDSLLNKFNNNYNNNNNEENKNNSIIYKKIKVRNNSTECRNFNNKNNSLTLNNSLLKDVEEKIKYYKNQEEKNNNLINVEDKIDIPKLNTNVVSKQYINIKKSFRNEKNDNNPSTNHDKKTSKDRKFTKKNVYENQINEYKSKFKKSNVKTNENKKGHLTTNSIYLRNITQKDIKNKAQKNNNKLNDNKKCYNKKDENSFEFVTAKKIYLTRRNSIIDRTIINSNAKRETNFNSLKYSPKRNNKAKKIKNIKNYYTNSELNIYPNKISRKINIPKRHLFANNNLKKDISVYLENNLNNTLKITNKLSNKLFSKDNVIKKKNLNKEKTLNNNNFKNKLINENKNSILVPKKFLFLTNNNSISINPNAIYDNQLKKLAMNSKKKTRNNNNQLNLSNNEKSRITKYILNRDKTAYNIEDKKYTDISMKNSKVSTDKNYNKTFNNNNYEKNISVKPTSPNNNLSSSKRKRATPNRINNIEFKKIKINLNKFKIKDNRNNKNKNKLNIEKKKILSFNINNNSLPENIISMYEKHKKMNKNYTIMTDSNSKNKNNSINDKYLSNSMSSNKNYESKFCSKTLSNEKIFPKNEFNKMKSLKKCNILNLITENNDQNIKINIFQDNKNDINEDKTKNLINRICYSNIVNNHKKNRIKINLNNYSNYYMYNKLKKNNNSIMTNSIEGLYDDIFRFYRINSNQSSFSDDNYKNNQFFHHKKALISNYNSIRNSQINNSNKNNYNSVNTNNSSFTNKFITKDNSKNNTFNDTEKKLKESPYNIVGRNINQNKIGNKFLYFKH